MKEQKLKSLPRLVFFSEDDGEYVATVPGLPLISGLGETKAKALSELDMALEACSQVAAQKGIPFPSPEVDSLTKAADMLNISELARRLNLTQSTLSSKLRRGTSLKPEEASAINSALRESGLALIAS